MGPADRTASPHSLDAESVCEVPAAVNTSGLRREAAPAIERCGHSVELARDLELARQRNLNRFGGRLVVGRRGRKPRQIELDLVVNQEGHDLRGVPGLLDRLVAEDLGPFVKALPLEVERHPEVGLVGAELGGDLRDEKLSEWLARTASMRRS